MTPNELAVRYRETRHPTTGKLLFESLIGYIYSLQGKPMMNGYDVNEYMGEIYLKMLDSAVDYDTKFGVDFILYFRMRIHGHFRAMRVKENKYLCKGDEELENSECFSFSAEEYLMEVENIIEELKKCDDAVSKIALTHLQHFVDGYNGDTERMTGGKIYKSTGLSQKQVKAVTQEEIFNRITTLIL